MAIEEDGIWAVGVVWGLNAVVLLFVVLRIHNRVALKHAFGLDDVAFMISFSLLLGVGVLITISSHYGFGQSYTPYNDNTAKALFCQSLGINFAGAGIVVIRCSLGLFLLRIFQERWQKLAIWGMIALLLLVMSVSIVLYWRECEPVAFSWDRRIKGAHCAGRFIRTSYAASAACVLADFFFALFPWLIIWRTNIKRRDRILVLSSLSLGVISGACGIARMTTMEGLTKPNLLKTSVYPLILGIIELAVAICNGLVQTLLQGSSV